MDPAEAVRAFRELGAHTMLPIHFDTFINSLDAPGDAPNVLARELKRQNVDAARVAVLAMGERRVLIPR
jgi:L-ascorbate metabolism protein UlaG (beta-lactamase superfamily)